LRRPILALTADEGDTAALLKETGGATIVDINDEAALYSKIPHFLRSVWDCTHPLADSTKIQRYTRMSQALELSQTLSHVTHLQSASLDP
jgi:hypothetical protein